MRRRRAPALLLMTALALLLPAHAVRAGGQEALQSVTVSFGGGLNTAQPPGNPANHHVLPGVIRVKAGGVVNFAVAGFHQIFVYNPGTTPQTIQGVLPAFPPNLFINYKVNLYYEGINPANAANPNGANAGSPPSDPTVTDNSLNRVEPVSFSQSGTYLVICNVTPHFRDGMWAWVQVIGN